MPKNITLHFDILKLFDAVMAEIEPDLMQQNIGTLSEKYAGETAPEKEVRSARYAAAYAEWKRRLGQIVSVWKKEILAYRDRALGEAKTKVRHDEEAVMSDIASTIEQL